MANVVLSKLKPAFRLLPLALAAVFLTAIAMKVAAMGEFVAAVQSSRLVPHALKPYAPVGILLAELYVSMMLVHPASRTVGMYSAIVLLMVFCIALAHSIHYGADTGCACFGRLPVQFRSVDTARWAILRDGVLVLLASLWLWTCGDPQPAGSDDPACR